MQKQAGLGRNVDLIVAAAVLDNLCLTNKHVPGIGLAGPCPGRADSDVIGADSNYGALGCEKFLDNALEADPWPCQPGAAFFNFLDAKLRMFRYPIKRATWRFAGLV